MLHSLLSSINMSYISFGEHYSSLYLQTRLRDSKQQSRCPFGPSMRLLFCIFVVILRQILHVHDNWSFVVLSIIMHTHTHTMQNGCAFNLFVFHSIATEFIQKLSAVQKAHSQQLSSLCVTFRRKAQDIKRNWWVWVCVILSRGQGEIDNEWKQK